MIFCTTDFKDFMPRKGFKCEGYLREYRVSETKQKYLFDANNGHRGV